MATLREKFASLQRELNEVASSYQRREEELRVEGMKSVEDKVGPMIVNLQKQNYFYQKQIRQLQEEIANLNARLSLALKNCESLTTNNNQAHKIIEKYRTSVRQELEVLARDKAKLVDALYSCINFKLSVLYPNRPKVDSNLLRQADLEIRNTVKRLDENTSYQINRIRNLNSV